MSNRVLAYSGEWLERAGIHRTDSRWVEAMLTRPDTRVIPMWRDKCMVGDAPVMLSVAEAGAVLAEASDRVFLGLDGDTGVFAADLSLLEESRALALVGAAATLDVRRLVGTLTATQAATLAYARGILYWNRNQRFCGACGGDTVSKNGGHLRICRRESCGKLLFPRIEPAVIVLVEAPGMPRRCLLGRHKKAPEGVYSTLAGFVEIGESLEDAVRREVAEEAGVRVDHVAYQASQAWPFPAGLMLGFRARAVSDRSVPDRDEIVETRWFTLDELDDLAASRHGQRSMFNNDSIEKFLIEQWMNENRITRETS